MNLLLWVAIRQKYEKLQDFALAVGVTPSKLSRVLRGKQPPDQEFKKVAAGRLGVTPNELFPNS
jgi:transcriptional regulator with XRE-family HTH domain